MLRSCQAQNKATENKATENKATENKATENKATENKAVNNKPSPGTGPFPPEIAKHEPLGKAVRRPPAPRPTGQQKKPPPPPDPQERTRVYTGESCVNERNRIREDEFS